MDMIADPHHFNADPDRAFHFKADPDPDPSFHFNLDPDPNPAPHRSDRIFEHGLKTLQDSILSLQASV
jgi:hypothetical protein